MKKIILVATVSLLLMSNANAGFLIDYQGLKAKPISNSTIGTPDGFSLLNGQFFGLIEQVGEGFPSITNSFGDEMSLSDAIGMIMPGKWFAYIDSSFTETPEVSWDANGDNWLSVLAKVGKDNGLRYIVDWDQKLIQISQSKGFVKPDYNDPIVMHDKSSGREVFIYTDKKDSPGFLLINGEYLPVSIVE